jgi:signal peptidase I
MLKIKHKKIFVKILQIIFIAFSLYYVIYRPFFITKVVGISMLPTFEEGQIVLATNLDKNYYVGDVVLLKHNSETLIKRVAYSSGQKILCADLGIRRYALMPPMKNVDKQISYLKKHGIYAYVLEIPKGQVFVLGDNESASEDSRNFGPIKISDIFAKVIE